MAAILDDLVDVLERETALDNDQVIRQPMRPGIAERLLRLFVPAAHGLRVPKLVSRATLLVQADCDLVEHTLDRIAILVQDVLPAVQFIEHRCAHCFLEGVMGAVAGVRFRGAQLVT